MWSFDLYTGKADRSNYRLKLWDVELRDVDGVEGGDREVWVRKKKEGRIG